MNANKPAGDDRVISVDGHHIAVRLYRSKGRGKAGVLVFLGGDPEQLAGMAAEAGCLVISIEAGIGADQGPLVLNWVHSHARELGGDASQLALGGACAGAHAALAIAQAAHGEPLALLLLVSPGLDLDDVQPARLPSTFVEAEAASEARGAVLDFVAALLEADVEVQLHLLRASGAATESDRDLRMALRADALKRAFAK